MELATILGLLAGCGAISYSIIAASGIAGFASFLDIPSLVIVIGGTIAATLVSYPLGQFLSIFSIAKNAFVNSSSSNDELITKFLDMGKTTRSEGLLALEKTIENENDEFLVKAVQMAIDGTQPDTMRSALTNEVDYLKLRHAQSQGIFETLAAQFPSWGMIGTLIGLVLLLKNLDDPSTIGPSMAVAILTTLYGSICANFLCNPIAKKLEIKSTEESIRRELIIEGVICLSEKAPSLVIERKLNSFLSNSQKQELAKIEK